MGGAVRLRLQSFRLELGTAVWVLFRKIALYSADTVSICFDI